MAVKADSTPAAVQRQTGRIELRCVECGAAGLPDAGSGPLLCAQCGASFERHRMQGIPVLVGSRSTLDVQAILAKEITPKDLDLGAAAAHWETGKLAELFRSLPGREMLVYGSGDGSDRKWLESQGYRVTNFDIFPSEYTDYVCDGHDLPFADNQFEIIASIAVYEHLHDPFLASREIYRVLKPGGTLVGSSAFLEPYHANSYFHMTHLGLREVLSRAGFQKIEIYPGWSFLESLNAAFWAWNRVGMIKRMSLLVNRLKFRWGMALWRLSYKVSGRKRPEELPLRFCGSLVFVATK